MHMTYFTFGSNVRKNYVAKMRSEVRRQGHTVTHVASGLCRRRCAFNVLCTRLSFLVDRTIGRAFGTLCRLSVCLSSVVCLLRHVRIAESEPYCHSILFVCLSVIPRPTAYHD